MDPPPLTLMLLAMTAMTTMTTMTTMTMTMTVMTTMTTTMTTMTAAATSIPTPTPGVTVVPLDMAPASFDDQYLGCGRAMAASLAALNRSEFHLGGHLAEAWTLAAAEWRLRTSSGRSNPLSNPLSTPLSTLSPAQATALLAYTAPLPLHRTFNAAVRVAGASGQRYRDSFPFKALHFLLTGAVVTLRAAQGPQCHRVFRGVRGVRFQAQPGRTVRFGHFASASLRNESSWEFGTDTAFQVDTCRGAAVRDFSFFPHEDEVLIPPFETFRVADVTNVTRGDVTNVTRGDVTKDKVRIWLRSVGTHSNFNCEWLRGQRCGDGPCAMDGGHSIPRPPSHLGGLLLLTLGLAVATGTL